MPNKEQSTQLLKGIISGFDVTQFQQINDQD
jgi:hypothetical protein